MSFNINCYFLLAQRKLYSSIVGDISGPFTETEINTIISPSSSTVTLIDTSIIYSITPPFSTNPLIKYNFVVGIPNRNGNNISKKQIYTYISVYNIPALLSVRPYISQGGRDTGEGAHIDSSNCITPMERKIAALKGWGLGNVSRLPRTYVNSLYYNNNFQSKICFHKL
jgi:hypothetical protein